MVAQRRYQATRDAASLVLITDNHIEQHGPMTAEGVGVALDHGESHSHIIDLSHKRQAFSLGMLA
jgi:hypothetical protein